MDLSGQTVVVVGLGRSGRAAARLASRAGATVVGVDARDDVAPLDVGVTRTGPAGADAVAQADVVVVSPGVAAAQPDVASAIAAGTDVVGELGFALRFVDCPVVAITGTNGKSSVTSYTGHLVRGAGIDAFVGGNLGVPLSEAALDGALELAVLEVSSYQLELPGTLAPRAAAILNLTPDHLARHGTMQAYAATKCRLLARMGPGDVALLPAGDARIAAAADGVGAAQRGWLGALPGVVREGRTARVRVAGLDVELDLSEVTLPGAHNLDHAATACALALIAGADAGAVQRGLAGLRALPHRMEPVAERDGVLWIDDSKATNVASTSVAVQGLDRPAVVLLGGEAKEGDDFTALAPALRRHRAVLAFGASGPAIAEALERAGTAVTRCDSLEQAVAHAEALVAPGEAVLLSPACASFDAFTDFTHRGRVFASLARRQAS